LEIFRERSRFLRHGLRIEILELLIDGGPNRGLKIGLGIAFQRRLAADQNRLD
jgi:hypothetical protein